MNQNTPEIIREYERLMDASLDIICTINRDGMFTRVSMAANRMLGYTTDELMGKPYLNFVEQADQEASLAMLAKAISGQPVNHFDNRIWSKDGNLIAIRWSANWNEISQTLYCIGRDVTEKIKSEKRVLESETRYRKLFLHHPLPIWIIDPDTKQFLEINEKAISHYGYSREEFLSMTALDIRPEADRERMLQIEQQKEGRNKVHQGIWKHFKKNGDVIDVEVTSHRMEFKGRAAAIVMVQDVTEKLRLEKQQRLDQQNMEAMINSTKDMIWSVDRSYELLAANQSFIETTELSSGIKVNPGYPMLMEEYYPEEHSQYWKTLYNRALEGENFYTQTSDVHTSPGEELWWETNFNPIYFQDKIIGVACHSRNITQNRRYQSELWQLNQKLETAQQLARLGYWEMNIATNELFWTMEVFSIWGRHPAEFKPNFENFIATLHPDDRSTFIQQREAVLSGSGDLDFQHRILLPDGTYRYVHERGSIFKDPLGKPLRYSGTVQDITQTKLYEQALQKANQELTERADQLARSNAELERFAYVASHDLQEPLRMISSFLQLLVKKYQAQLDDTAKQYISFATGGAERMKKLINDLLEYSRIENRQLEFSEVDMKAVLNEVQLNLHESISTLGVTIDTQDLPVIRNGHFSGLVQLFQNLISNAIKYRSEEPISISISCREEEKYWQIAVKDNGIGIESDYFEKIFIIFQRLHNMAEYSGTGIGLAICKKIVEQHGGKIWVYSEENRGSTFYFTIKK